MTGKVIIPLGWGAGREADLPQALQALAVEMQGHAEDLREQAHRRPQEAPALEARADDLKRYALALLFIWYQTEAPAQRDLHIGGSLAEYLELAGRYGLALPPELEAQARKERPSRKPQERG